ncbi:5-formyltetrahydrofolate cyclo-ligase [Cytobacillus sp. FJAT-54145]|uniref:5-formyltetrahydrofolate cyclo-ligase n=1 Tax=Cytobacillus spartinae TaxID=3299023 RepID=A0ABW6KE52_9BACI
MLSKKDLRKKLQSQLSSITKPQYEYLSYTISNNLFMNPVWQKSKVIGITISNPPEVDTFQIIRKAWEENKTVVIPKCDPKARVMNFRTLTAFNQLETVYSGLLEPIEEMTKETNSNEIDLLVVPGLAFTREGYRLGFGGGYYDRYLGSYNGKTVSLAFHQQILDHIPVEEHDLPVSQIITDQESILIDV